jgi:hypothetical protein
MWKRAFQDWESAAGKRLLHFALFLCSLFLKKIISAPGSFLSSLSSNQNEIFVSGFAESGKNFAQSE